jgi:hypothetical protein
MGGLLYLMRRRLSSLEGRRILAGSLQAGAASLGMGLVIWIWLGLASSWPVWLTLAGGMALGFGVYALGIWLLKVPELGELRRALQARLSGKK